MEEQDSGDRPAQLRARARQRRAAAAARADGPQAQRRFREARLQHRDRTAHGVRARRREGRADPARARRAVRALDSRRSRRTWPRSSGSSSAMPSRWSARRGQWPTRSSWSRTRSSSRCRSPGSSAPRVRVPADADEAAVRAAALGDRERAQAPGRARAAPGDLRAGAPDQPGSVSGAARRKILFLIPSLRRGGAERVGVACCSRTCRASAFELHLGLVEHAGEFLRDLPADVVLQRPSARAACGVRCSRSCGWCAGCAPT